VSYTPSRRFDALIRYRQKNKFVSANSANEIDFIVPFMQQNLRWQLSYQASPSVNLRCRAEWIMINDASKAEKENGYLLYQDINKKVGSKMSITLRYALFDTKSYNSRIYTYETDIPSSYSIPSYYYKGSRTYVMLNYNITRNIECWFRWSQTYYANKNVISKGTLNEIDGNTKSEIKFQLRLNL
jgi:hypothetical protein